MIPFKVGDKVVCIDSAVGFEQFIEIKEGEIYTISWIGPFEHYTQGSYIGVRLKGVDRGMCHSSDMTIRRSQRVGFARLFGISWHRYGDCLQAAQ